jgi:hypothetical protein
MTPKCRAITSLIALLTMLPAGDSAASRRRESSRITSGNATALLSRQASVVRALVVKGKRLVLDSLVTLNTAQQVLGHATLIAPRHHDDRWSVCYSARDSIGPFTIRLQSDDMGGPNHRLLGFELSRESGSPAEASRCASVGFLSGVKTDNGLYLGMPVTALLKIMGPALRDRGQKDSLWPVRRETAQHLFRFHEHMADSSAGRVQGYDADGWLAVRAADGRVTGLLVWYVETM